jgi:STE24 endopeptidase
VLLLPVFYRVRPIDRAALSERLVRLAERAGAPVIGAYEWGLSGHTRKANAALAGIGRSRRILLSDTMLDAYSDDEIEVILAHELSHHVHHDLWRGMALQAGTLFAGFFFASVVLRAAVPWLGLHGEADVAGAPLLLLVAGTFTFAMLPLGNAVSRAQERRADRFALQLTRNPQAFVTAMRRLSQQNLAEERPSAIARWLFYSHPPMRERIAAAQAWVDVAAPLPAHGIVPAKE